MRTYTPPTNIGEPRQMERSDNGADAVPARLGCSIAETDVCDASMEQATLFWVVVATCCRASQIAR